MVPKKGQSAQSDSRTTSRARERRAGQRMPKEERQRAQENFLKFYRQTAVVATACLNAGIARSTYYEWLDRDPKFAEENRHAEEDANDVLRNEIFRRGVQGVNEPAIANGRLVYEWEPVLKVDGSPKVDQDGKPIMKRGKQVYIRRYSDRLLLSLAASRMREFRDRLPLDEGAGQELPKVIIVNVTNMPPPEPIDPYEQVESTLAQTALPPARVRAGHRPPDDEDEDDDED